MIKGNQGDDLNFWYSLCKECNHMRSNHCRIYSFNKDYTKHTWIDDNICSNLCDCKEFRSFESDIESILEEEEEE